MKLRLLNKPFLKLFVIVFFCFISNNYSLTNSNSIKSLIKSNSQISSASLNNKYELSFQNQTKKTTLLKIASSLTNTKNLKVNKEPIIIDNTKFDNNNSNSNNPEQLSGSIIFNLKTNEITFSSSFLEEKDIASNSKNDKVLIARGRYTKTLNMIGWSKLFIETFNNCSSEVQSFAAGYIEGKLTARNVLEFYKNLIGIHADEEQELKDVFKYYGEVEASIRKKTSKESLSRLNEEDELEYWITVAMIQAQTDGLHAGYNSEMKSEFELSFEQIYFINADGEVPELMTLFKTKRESNKTSDSSIQDVNIDNKFSFKEKASGSNAKDTKLEKFSKEYLQKYFGESDPNLLWSKLMAKSHCSGLIKVLTQDNNDLKDVLVSHTTWDSYSEMHRIFKYYDFKYNLFGRNKHSAIMFSSYPGTLTSTDDFYLLNNKISVLETTLEILDRDLYVTASADASNHVPNYIRISTANRIAETGKEWTDVFKKNNSGTYNSQWMVIDYQALDNANMTVSDKIVDGIIVKNKNESMRSQSYSKDSSSYNRFYKTKNDFDSMFSDEIEYSKNYNYGDNSNNSANYNGPISTINNEKQTISNTLRNINISDYGSSSSNNMLNYYNFKQKFTNFEGRSQSNNISQTNQNNNKKINSDNPLLGFFHVLEQIPGYIHVEDMTDYLFTNGYWASYNRPFFPSVYSKAGYQEMMRKYGLVYSYFENPRAKIFKNKVKQISSVQDLQSLMQSTKDLNNITNINSISPRFDLNSNYGFRKASGGIDTKITSYLMSKKSKINAISGPAYHDNGIAFNWGKFMSEPHYGLPLYWNFKWNEMNYENIKNGSIESLE